MIGAFHCWIKYNTTGIPGQEDTAQFACTHINLTDGRLCLWDASQPDTPLFTLKMTDVIAWDMH